MKEKMSWKEKLYYEARLYGLLSLYLIIFTSSLTAYRRLILGEETLSLAHFGYNIFESLVLAKIVLLGNNLKLGDRFQNHSLIIPTIYKTLVFSLFVIFFSVAEDFVIGYFKGHNLSELYEKLLANAPRILLTKISLFFSVFILFFGFLELDRVIGEDKVYKLFFRRNKPN